MARVFITREFFPVNTEGFKNTFISVFFDDTTNTLDFVNDKTGALVTSIGGVALTTNLIAEVQPTAQKSDFSGKQYIGYPIGKIICIQNYNDSDDAMTVQKTSLANNDHTDWIIIATENKKTTGSIGGNPL